MRYFDIEEFKDKLSQSRYDYQIKSVKSPQFPSVTSAYFIYHHQQKFAYARDLNEEEILKKYPVYVKITSNKYTDIQECDVKLNSFEMFRRIPLATITHDGKSLLVTGEFKVLERLFGLQINENLEIEQPKSGIKYKSNFRSLIDINQLPYDFRSHKRETFNLTLNCLPCITYLTSKKQSINNILTAALKNENTKFEDGFTIDCFWPRPDGIKKVFDKVYPIAEKIKLTDPYTYICFRSLVYGSKRTIDSVNMSTVFNNIFSKVETEEQFVEALKPFGNEKATTKRYRHNGFDEACKELESFKDKRRQVLKASTTRAFNKVMKEFEFLNLNEKDFPLTYKAISDGDIPIGTFFRKKEQYFLLNDNFQLWEEMLKQHRDTTLELAKETAKRTALYKDLMSYFHFVLYKLPNYLEKHTKYKWKCIPQIIVSSHELEPGKRKSLLTPTVDNDKKVVLVPYACLKTSYQDSYSHTYNLLETGFSFGGNTCIKDIEEKLDGRNDYGMMFYTLTGADTYPTFLIIFDRLHDKVSFYRTYPPQSKSGEYNGIHNWIKVCYTWMMGNTSKDRIITQKDDLVFLLPNEKVECSKLANSYGDHKFEPAILVAEHKDDVIAGHILVEKPTLVDDMSLPPGLYEMRQCRSWEGSKGVWKYGN